jgi:hypothetical protein
MRAVKKYSWLGCDFQTAQIKAARDMGWQGDERQLIAFVTRKWINVCGIVMASMPRVIDRMARNLGAIVYGWEWPVGND